MADNKKYYYLKLKDNFFDSDEMIILESMADGYLYSNILLKLYLRSLKYEGRLMFNNRIPFNSTMLAQVTRHSVGVIEKAMRVFRDLELIEVLDSGAIYITDIQNFIGRSSTEADRKREYRKRIELEKKGQLKEIKEKDKCPDKSPPEIEIEKELDIDIEKDIELEKEKKKPKKKKPVVYDPDEKLNQAILDFIDFRKKIRATMTDRAITLMLSKLNKMTNDNDEKIQILEQSIMNGWKSVYPLKKDKKQGKQSFDDFVEVGKEWLNDSTGVFDDISNN